MFKHYMRKGDADIVAIPANEWAKYRSKGYDFSTEAKYMVQQAEKASEAPSDEKVGRKKRTIKRS